MGRNAPWLTLAASNRISAEDKELHKFLGQKKVNAVKDTIMSLVPEKEVSIRSIIMRAKEILSKKGALNIAVSEGFLISRKDPLWGELIRKNPVLAAKISGKQEEDIHGHIRLAGVSEFICSILVTRWDDEELDLGLSRDVLRHTIFGYIGRGLKPNEYDYWLARQYGKGAANVINEGKQTGVMMAYSDRMNPVHEEPLVIPIEEVLMLNGEKFSRNLHTLGEKQSKEIKAWFKKGGYADGFDIFSDQYLSKAGVLMESKKKPIGYEVEEDNAVVMETTLNFDAAVKMLREDFISSAVSGWAHERGSIFEVPENTPSGLLTMAVADKNPVDYAAWDNEDIASWEKIEDTIMILLPGDTVPFSQILKEAANIKRKYGVVNIAVASNYQFNMNDSLIKELLETDPYLKAKFDLTNSNMNRETFTIKDVSKFIQSALVKYYPDAFPGESHARCNQLGDMYFVHSPTQKERETYTKRIQESIGEDTAHVTAEVKSLTNEISNHMVLNMDKPVDVSDTIVLMRTDLVESISGELNPFIKHEYTVMTQKFRKYFDNGRGVEEFDTNNDLLSRAETLLREGKKIIILDDTTINKNNINVLEENTGKENGKQFCVIASRKMVSKKEPILYFVNLYAMALMGVALLQDDYEGLRLFDLAYELFSGEENQEALFSRFKTKQLSIITVMPRMVKLTGDLIEETILKKLFAAAA
ncbi:MAG: hypothetical protein ABIH09_02435 [Candidatus Omnitrophota bacterium]